MEVIKVKKNSIEELMKKISIPLLDELNFDFVDVEFVKEGPNRFLRLYIDKAEGITLEDCQKVSEKLNDALDEIDPIEENYFLEVSSPGIDRPLKTDDDFKKALNEDVEINLYKAIDGIKRLEGKLVNYDDEAFIIEDEKIGEIRLERNVVSKINLSVKF